MKRGVACICLSAFGFSLMAVFVKLADSFGEPVPAVEKAFFRNAIAMIVALADFLRRRGGMRAGAASADWVSLLARSIFGTLGIVANFYAVSRIPLGDAMALNKTAPFFTLAACWVMMGEKIRLRQALAVTGAFAGAMLVVKPGFSGSSGAGAVVGLLGGAFAGIAYALVHRLGVKGVDGAFIVFFFSMFSTLACLPFFAFGDCNISPAQFAVLTAAGVAAAVGQFGITWAYRFAEPRQIAIYDYCGIVFAVLLGLLFFGQIPDLTSVAGMLIIVAMAVGLHSVKVCSIIDLKEK